LALEPCCPLCICAIFVVLTAVRFDDQSMLCAREIDNEPADRMLPAKSVSAQATMA